MNKNTEWCCHSSHSEASTWIFLHSCEINPGRSLGMRLVPARTLPSFMGCTRCLASSCTCPLLQPDASFLPSGDHAMHKIQCLCALQVWRGVSVNTSQNRTVVSPDPLASCLESQRTVLKWEASALYQTHLPSGLKLTVMTASVWPEMTLRTSLLQ